MCSELAFSSGYAKCCVLVIMYVWGELQIAFTKLHGSNIVQLYRPILIQDVEVSAEKSRDICPSFELCIPGLQCADVGKLAQRGCTPTISLSSRFHLFLNPPTWVTKAQYAL